MKPKHWIRIIAFVLVCAVLVFVTAKFLQIVSPRTTVRVHGMYKEPENSIDVALFGASDVYTCFYNPLAYEKFGFTSYNVCSEGSTGVLYESMVRELRKTQDPQLYVFEMWAFQYTDQYGEVNLRRWIDSIADSENRRRTIEEVVPEDMQESFKIPFLKYHSNWYYIKDCIEAFVDKMNINRRGYSITKGYSTITEVYKEPQEHQPYKTSEKGMEALEKLLNYLNEEGIENVLFMRLPVYNIYDDKDSYFKAIEMIKAHGYDFLDMYAIRDEIGMDLSSDYYNETHVNSRGTLKMTNYLGNYINEHYDLDKEHSPQVKEEWDYCASFNDQVFEKCESNIQENINIQLWMHKDFGLQNK